MVFLNKDIIVAIIASVVLVSFVGFSFWNVFAAENLQLRGPDGVFRFYDFSTAQGSIEVCNPLPFFSSFNQLGVIVFFEEENKGSFIAKGTTLEPMSSKKLDVVFTSDDYAPAQYLFMHFDGMFTGTTPIRIDPAKFSVMTEIQTPIIGVIPYSVTKQYTGWEFWQMVNEESGVFEC